MRASPKLILLLLYIFFFIMLVSQVLAQLPITEATAPWIALIVALFVIGLAVILGWDYIIPLLVRSYRLGECKVEDTKYLICRYKSSPEFMGYVGFKVIPTHPIADMPKERRDSYLQSVQGLLAGAQFETVVAYIGMKDRFRETILDRLKRERQRLLSMSFRESPMLRENINRLNTEIRILEQVPIILEGFYIALARDYHNDKEELKRKLEADGIALHAMLSGRLGVKVDQLKGEELRSILSYLLFGSVVQVSV